MLKKRELVKTGARLIGEVCTGFTVGAIVANTIPPQVSLKNKLSVMIGTACISTVIKSKVSDEIASACDLTFDYYDAFSKLFETVNSEETEEA